MEHEALVWSPCLSRRIYFREINVSFPRAIVYTRTDLRCVLHPLVFPYLHPSLFRAKGGGRLPERIFPRTVDFVIPLFMNHTHSPSLLFRTARELSRILSSPSRTNLNINHLARHFS